MLEVGSIALYPSKEELWFELSQLSTNQLKYNYLRRLFLSVDDVRDYIDNLKFETQEGDDGFSKGLIKCLEDYEIYLIDYLKRTAQRVIKFKSKVVKNFVDPDVGKLNGGNPNEIFLQSRRIRQAMKIINAPIGPRSLTLEEAAGKSIEMIYRDCLESLAVSEEVKKVLLALCVPHEVFRNAVVNHVEKFQPPLMSQFQIAFLAMSSEQRGRIIDILDGKLQGSELEYDDNDEKMKAALNTANAFLGVYQSIKILKNLLNSSSNEDCASCVEIN